MYSPQHTIFDGYRYCFRAPMRGNTGGVTTQMIRRIPCLMIVLCLCLLPLTVYAEQVRIVTFHYPPVMDSNKPDGGLMGEMVQAAFHEVNIEPELVYYPAKRMLANHIGTETYLACIGPVVLVDRQPEDRKNQVIRVPPLVNILMILLPRLNSFCCP